ncbi:hypothetical protein ArsFIN_21530 [Arsenophonus nasoniae]|uniref:Uncharacterized protein n=1 Tax=Arsenophonus nasoniae TaxID=638 RepID=A0A4P7KU48_9GAMM|nr:hypothetical protein ArsFIN_21530 [Arsenophonus nasoniae]
MDNIQSTLHDTNSITQYKTSSYSDGMESISQINELMMMLTEMLKNSVTPCKTLTRNSKN